MDFSYNIFDLNEIVVVFSILLHLQNNQTSNTMSLNKRISAFEQLSICLQDTVDGKKTGNSQLKQQIEQEQFHNPWFIPSFVSEAIRAIAQMIDRKQIQQWILPYHDLISAQQTSLRTGVIMAGNIPLAGFHDFVSVLMAGHIFTGKLSSNDAHLLPIIAEMLCDIEPAFKNKIIFCYDKLPPVDRIITTGSNNAARHFSFYFQQYPSIIRKHCNSLAVLDGNESDEDLKNLAKDIFLYFGLGCRSVSKIYVPNYYSFDRLFAAIDHYKNIATQHNKYLNNLEYQKTVHLINAIPFLDMGILIFKEDPALASPIGIVHYQYYNDKDLILKEIASYGETLQCVVGKTGENAIPFGKAQYPALNNYANGINTLLFLIENFIN
ncbi:MAG: hypothetical protein LBG80_03840 [Bacteroidales bacterium]|jgi:hypothetical protein|nr:hypothetical protein [Bacteroidales bacterium]